MNTPPHFAAALSRRQRPVTVYFRDDDAGWDDDALQRLLEVFARYQAPLDLALIPQALHDALIETLRACAARQPLGIHQHGYAHVNHETTGRKCEFGPARPAAAQAADIAAGARTLRAAFSDLLQPIFTPPWNRCTQDTADALVEAGLRALSRDAGAVALDTGSLQSLPVHLDWQKRAQSETAFAAALEREAAVGIMLHHAVMDARDHTDLAQLLDWMRDQPCVRLAGMGDLIKPEENKDE